MPDDSFDLLTIASFESDHEAQIVRTRLEAAEIPAFVQGSHDPYSLIYPTHSFRLQIRSRDLDAAKEVLGEQYQISDPEAGFDSCPRCGSQEVEQPQTLAKTAFALNWLFGPLVVLLGLRKKTRQCKSCEHRWN